jgi:hypothetical protein
MTTQIARRSFATRVTRPPEGIADLLTEFSGDYWDCFAIAVPPGEASPRWWASSTLRGADGLFGRLVWARALGFELASGGSDNTLVGWAVDVDSDTALVLRADGPRMTGLMAFVLADGHIYWTTAVRHHNAIGSSVWAILRPVHRQIAPRCLELSQRQMCSGRR